MDRTSFIPEPGRLSLKYELHNAGPDGTRGVVLEATLTGNLQSVSQLTTPGTRCSHRLRRGGATVRCELPAIPSGGGVTLFVQAQVKSRGSLDLKERVEVRSVDAVDPLPDDNVLEAQSRFVRQRPSNVARRHGAPRPPPPGQVEPGSPRR
jgi:hypothetical protein